MLLGKEATTYHSAFDELANYGVNVVSSKVVHDGKIITAGGVSSGLELGFYLLRELFGLTLAQEVADKIEYKMANCCQPIPGDDVFGFITSAEGLKIHRTNCPNASTLLANYGHRVIKAKWAKNKEISFLTGVKINGIDDVGIIHKITNVVSGELKMNMRSMSIDSGEGLFEGTIMVYVNDKEELNELCLRLEELEGIHRVTRLDATN